jgi:hypothetical protein
VIKDDTLSIKQELWVIENMKKILGNEKGKRIKLKNLRVN